MASKVPTALIKHNLSPPSSNQSVAASNRTSFDMDNLLANNNLVLNKPGSMSNPNQQNNQNIPPPPPPPPSTTPFNTPPGQTTHQQQLAYQQILMWAYQQQQQQQFACWKMSPITTPKTTIHTPLTPPLELTTPPTEKRSRTVFSMTQLDELEKVFKQQQYVVGSERTELAYNLRLTEAQVKVWFQNRRIKERKLQKFGKNGSTGEVVAVSASTTTAQKVLDCSFPVKTKCVEKVFSQTLTQSPITAAHQQATNFSSTPARKLGLVIPKQTQISPGNSVGGNDSLSPISTIRNNPDDESEEVEIE